MTKKINHKQFRILVVDDSPATLEVIQRNLSGEGYQVFTCTNVNDAVNFLSENLIDLIITDFKMPQISGLDLVRHVRENLYDAVIIMNKIVKIMILLG